MAHISISVSSEFNSRMEAKFTPSLPLLSIDLNTNIYSGYDERPGEPASHCHDKCLINVHGTAADLRLFAEHILAAFATDEVKEFEMRHANIAEPLRSVVNSIGGLGDGQ